MAAGPVGTGAPDSPPTGGRRFRSTVVVATVVTAAVAIPMLVGAVDARRVDDVAADGIVLHVDGDTAALDGARIAPGASASVEIDDPELLAVAWVLAVADGAPVDEGVDRSPPLLVEPTRTALGALPPGRYDLLVTATRADGDTVRRAARFEVGVSP